MREVWRSVRRGEKKCVGVWGRRREMWGSVEEVRVVGVWRSIERGVEKCVRVSKSVGGGEEKFGKLGSGKLESGGEWGRISWDWGVGVKGLRSGRGLGVKLGSVGVGGFAVGEVEVGGSRKLGGSGEVKSGGWH